MIWAATGFGFPWPAFVTVFWGIGIASQAWMIYRGAAPITEAEIQDIVGRLDVAIRRAMDGFPREVDVRESSSLSIGDLPIAAE